MTQPINQDIQVSINDRISPDVVRGIREGSANLAICVVPREVADAYLEIYGLRCIPLDEPWARRRFAICYRDGDSLSAAARLLIEHLRRDD